jgi:RHS repeat-associated protein
LLTLSMKARLIALALLLAGLPVANSSRGATQPWALWQRNPLTIPVALTATNIYGETNGCVQVVLADSLTSQAGAGSDTPTNGPTAVANLGVRHQYELQITTTNVSSLTVSLSWRANWTPLARGGRNGKPRTYYLLIDGNGTAVNEATISLSGLGDSSTNKYVMELTERLPVHWLQEDGSNDPSLAAGDGARAEIGPGKSTDPTRCAITWSVSLGRLMDGVAAGRLTLREPAITPSTFTPTNLYYTAASDLTRDQVSLITLTTNCPVLRQVMSLQTFVDIVPLANSTELRFYLPGQAGSQTNELGQYTNIFDNPFVVWALVNPAPPGTNQLQIVERRNGQSRTNTISYTPGTTTWMLQQGSGPETRVETRQITINSTGGTTNRVEVDDIRRAGDSTAAYTATETYHLFPWGYELVKTEVPVAGSTALTHTFTYYTDSADPTSYHQLQSIVYPDGYWEKRLYDSTFAIGALKYVLRPNLDSPSRPDDADFSNSIYDWYCWVGDPIEWGWKRTCMQGLDIFGDPVDDVLRDRYDTSLPVGSGLLEEETAEARFHHDFLGDYSLVMDDSYDFALARHPVFHDDSGGALESSYYHGGTYDPVTRAFTVSSDEIWKGPDWRRSTICWGYDDYSFAGGNNDPFAAPPQVVTKAEGQWLWDAIWWAPSGIEVTPNRTWKDVEIYHLGSLAQRERYVLVGVSQDPDDQPIFELIGKWCYGNDALGHTTNITWIDGASATSRIVYSADYKGTNTHDGDLKLLEQDEQGVWTTYGYDSLKRTVMSIKEGVVASGGFASQPAVTNSLAYDAQDRVLRRTMAAGNLSLTSSAVYDVSGRLTSQTETNGLTTTLSYAQGGRITTRTLPSGATEVTENYLDRRLKSRTGTAIVSEYHTWENFGLIYEPDDYPFAVSSDSGGMVDTIHYGSPTSARCRFQGQDNVGRVFATATPDWQSSKQVELDTLSVYGRPKLYYGSQQPGLGNYTRIFYDFAGRTNVQLRLPSPNEAGLASLDRIQYSIHAFQKVSGAWFDVETNLVFLQDNSAAPTILSIAHKRLNGFPSGNILFEVTSWDADTNTTVVTTCVDRTSKKVTEVTAAAQSTLSATSTAINGLLQSETTVTVAAPTRHYYDALGRQVSLQSSLGFTATQTYNEHGQVVGRTDFTGASTAYEYYPNGVTGAGQVKNETRANGKKTHYSYTPRGELYRTWGDVPYPTERVYSDYGELVQLRTFRGGSGWTGATWPSGNSYDSTAWQYQESSGLLAGKTDALGRTVSYTYTNGLLFTRTWARGITLTNTYNGLGELIAQEYTDNTPTVLLTNLNRVGLPRMIIDASGSSRLTYDHASRLTLVTNLDGLLAGLAATNHFQAPYGRDCLSVLGSANTVQHTYGYEEHGRLATVSSGPYSAEYTYLDNADLLRRTTCKNNGATVLTTTRSWEYGMRLAAIANEANGAVVSSHAYRYDALNRRIQAALEDGSIWNYNYNDRDELVGAHRYWSDWSPVTGQQYGYNYDTIGNRNFALSGGDASGANLRQTDYTVNSLNQYTSIVTPGYKDLCGVAYATNEVVVNTGTADRKGEYFHREITVPNNDGPLWQGVTVASGGTTKTGGSPFPANNQTLTYDADGNLTFDGIWTYEWDGENRLTVMTMTNIANVTDAKRLRLEFAYDLQGRRVQKKVSHWNAGDWALDSDSRFVYDGWNLLAILNSSFILQTSFMWGQDLSGTMDQAGGIGGLLLTTFHGTSATNCFVGYDGNGNVTALLDAAGAAVLARYEYSPFGELIRATGLIASANPFRFSTKFFDSESALLCYGYRFYSPAHARWLGRDRTGEQGGINLYAFLCNKPLGYFDTLGDKSVDLYQVYMMEDTIRFCLDSSFESGLAGKRMAIDLMLDWFSAGGKFDFKANSPMNTYNIGRTTLHADEFGNFLAGYAAGYAFIQSGGDIDYILGVHAAGSYYGLQENRWNHRGLTLEQVVCLGDDAASINMLHNGEIEGVCDALFKDVYGN